MADLHLVLGSSLTVSPACTMPEKTVKKGGKLVICNLQDTPLNGLADSVIHCRTDTLMTQLMAELGIPVPSWKLLRKAFVHTLCQKRQIRISVGGLEPYEHLPASIFKTVEMKFGNEVLSLTKEPFEVVRDISPFEDEISVTFKLHFMGHFSEPYLEITQKISLFEGEASSVYQLTYFPFESRWEWFLEKPEKEDVSNQSITSALEIPNQIHVEIWKTSGEYPSSCFWGTVSSVSVNQQNITVLCGGVTKTSDSAKIFTFNPRIKEWNSFGSNLDLPFVKKQRWGHSAVVIPEFNPTSIYLFGGWDSQCQYADLHVYDVQNNSMCPIQTKGVGPAARACHSVVAVGKEMLIFGGSICVGGPYNFYNDMFIFNPEKRAWRKVECTGDIPSPRAQHSLTKCENYLILIGGYDGTSILNDVYLFDLGSSVWNQIKTTGPSPFPDLKVEPPPFRVHPASHTSFVVGYQVVVHGMQGTFCLNLRTFKWRKIKSNSPTIPASSCHVACLIEPNQWLLFGGSLKSTFVLNFDTPLQLGI